LGEVAAIIIVPSSMTGGVVEMKEAGGVMGGPSYLSPSKTPPVTSGWAILPRDVDDTWIEVGLIREFDVDEPVNERS